MSKLTITLISIMGLLVLIFGGIAVKAVFFPMHSISKSIDMGYGVTNNILTGDNAIYNYEWFKNREADIRRLYKTEERAIEAKEEFLKMFPDTEKWTMQQQNDFSRLSANITGVGNMLDMAIEDYNAKASMQTRNIFKDNLPSNMTRSYLTGKELRK